MFAYTPQYCATTIASAAALNISNKQRTRLQQQAMSMAQYCGLMADRASTMLNFIEVECPDNRGDVLTLFREKYPQYGLRSITLSVTTKMGKLFVCLLACSFLLVSEIWNCRGFGYVHGSIFGYCICLS